MAPKGWSQTPDLWHFADVSFPMQPVQKWNDWHWQLRNRIRDLDALSRIITLSEEERRTVAGEKGSLPLAVTPYYASLLYLDGPAQPVRRTGRCLSTPSIRSHRKRGRIRWGKRVTVQFRVSFTAIQTGFFFWSRISVQPIAGIAPVHGLSATERRTGSGRNSGSGPLITSGTIPQSGMYCCPVEIL